MSEAIDSMIKRITERQRYEFALSCARRVQHIMRDSRSVAALDTRERWPRGKAMDAEMDAARAAPWHVAWDAARDAVWAASRASSRASAQERSWQRAELERMLAEGGGA